MKLTAAQEDYLEAVYRLERAHGPGTVRIKDIAEHLGTKLPTVTRTVRKLTRLGLLVHAERKGVGLSEEGRRMAEAVVHRHDDLLHFLREVLGVSPAVAESDACQVEHGLSAETAQRLHEFLLFLDRMTESERASIQRFLKAGSRKDEQFDNLPESRTTGWRT